MALFHFGTLISTTNILWSRVPLKFHHQRNRMSPRKAFMDGNGNGSGIMNIIFTDPDSKKHGIKICPHYEAAPLVGMKGEMDNYDSNLGCRA